MSSRCVARRTAAFTCSAAGDGSAHCRTWDCASSIEEANDDFCAFAPLPTVLVADAYWCVTGGRIMSTDDAYVGRLMGKFVIAYQLSTGRC
jgi:hypothetical protein